VTALFTALLTTARALRHRFRTLRAEQERGSVSVEQVIITLALLGIAIALVAVIANAVTSRSSQIQ
jgi:hypothetical protein